MIYRAYLGLGGVALGCGLALAACSSDGSSGGGYGATGGTAGSGATGGTAGSGATGGAAGATGGTAGSGATGGTAGSGATGGSGGAAGSTGGAAGAGGSGTAGDHLLISEVGIEPGTAEFIEIYNPTSAAVDLTDYYLSDNSAYYTITAGAWSPQGTAGTDFVARFPAGASIAADAVVVVAAQPDYEATFGGCPDYVLSATGADLSCGGGSVPAMLIPPNGSVGDQAGALISNSREMVVLFTWDGSASTVADVDYVTWGSDYDNNTRIDKSSAAGYAADTARGSQLPAVQGVAADAGASLAIERCAIEPSETLSGGNGLTGHDETSEDMGAGFASQGTPTPGTKNACL